MSASFVLDGWYRKVGVTSNPGGGEFSSLFFSFIGTSTHPFSIIDFILTVPAPLILFYTHKSATNATSQNILEMYIIL